MNDILIQEKYIKELRSDPNYWRVFRGFLTELGIDEERQDTIQGFVANMMTKALE
jgi:hypothetical protein